jgi:hypothetical protein
VRRQRTAAEAAAVAEHFEVADDLYQTSVLARDEYVVKPEGGVHGPFSVADLLRDPANGDYTVPEGPTLLGGFTAKLFGTTLRFGGILTGAEPTTSAFVYGHHGLDIAIGDFQVRAEGDFVAGSGSLWQTIPAPSGNLHAQDAVGFSGHVVVKHGGEKLLEGSAEGDFTRSARGKTSARLTVDIAAEGSLDGPGEESFLRVGWSLGGHLDVELADELKVTAKATASVTVERATFETNWVVVEPAHTLCGPAYIVDSVDPPAGHWGWACITTPEVRLPEIDFSHPDWEPVAEANCALTASVRDDGITFGLKLNGLGAEVTGVFGTTLTLPGLI